MTTTTTTRKSAKPATPKPRATTERFVDEHGRAAVRHLTDDPEQGIAAGSELLLKSEVKTTRRAKVEVTPEDLAQVVYVEVGGHHTRHLPSCDHLGWKGGVYVGGHVLTRANEQEMSYPVCKTCARVAAVRRLAGLPVVDPASSKAILK